MLDLLILFVIAVFFISRLRKVLGKHVDDGSAKQKPKRSITMENGKVVNLSPRPAEADPVRVAEDAPILADISNPDVTKGLMVIKAAEPDFSVKEFMHGAKLAFEMIVEAFAKGDKSQLRPLLNEEIFADFEEAINARKAAHKHAETTLASIQSADITDAAVKGKNIEITVQFVTEQLSVVRDKDGNIIEGDASIPHLVTDEWTFARPVRSPNPNWLLVAT